MNSMWDASIATLMQLDAYFSMLGMFNTIKKEDVTKDAVKYLSDWLTTVKSTNSMNVQNLGAISAKAVQIDTQVHANNMSNFYKELNKRIDNEMVGLDALKTTAVK
jgi:succinylarginine dihydrolase